MGFFGKSVRKNRLTGHDGDSQESEAIAREKKTWAELERLITAAPRLPSVRGVGPPEKLTLGGGAAAMEQKYGDNELVEEQQEAKGNVLLRIWEEEEESGHDNPMVRDIVLEVEEVDAERLLAELVSFSRALSSWGKKW